MVKLNNAYNKNFKGKPKIRVENGIVVFKNRGQYLRTINLLSSYNKNKLYNWAKSLGFVPYNKRLAEAMDALDKVNSESELNVIMKKFQDFITDRHRNGETYIEWTVLPNPYTNIANRDGLYIIGKIAYRILGEYKLEINRAKMNILLAVHYSDIINNKVPAGIKLKRYGSSFNFMPVEKKKSIINGSLNIDTTSGNYTSTDYKYSLYAQNQTSNREVRLQVVAYWDAYPTYNYVSYYAFIDASAYKKTWWLFGSWLPYKTEINIEGTNIYQDDFIIETPWGTKSYDIPHMVSTEDVRYMKLPSPYYGFNDTWYSYPGPEMYIISAHLKAWTRGTTTEVFANINYDF